MGKFVTMKLCNKHSDPDLECSDHKEICQTKMSEERPALIWYVAIIQKNCMIIRNMRFILITVLNYEHTCDEALLNLG